MSKDLVWLMDTVLFAEWQDFKIVEGLLKHQATELFTFKGRISGSCVLSAHTFLWSLLLFVFVGLLWCDAVIAIQNILCDPRLILELPLMLLWLLISSGFCLKSVLMLTTDTEILLVWIGHAGGYWKMLWCVYVCNHRHWNLLDIAHNFQWIRN